MKSFVVKYQIEESSTIKHRARSIHVLMDGHVMKEAVSLPDDKKGTVDGVRTSDNKIRPFMFADIQMTGADYPPFSTVPPYSAYALHSLSR